MVDGILDPNHGEISERNTTQIRQTSHSTLPSIDLYVASFITREERNTAQ